MLDGIFPEKQKELLQNFCFLLPNRHHRCINHKQCTICPHAIARSHTLLHEVSVLKKIIKQQRFIFLCIFIVYLGLMGFIYMQEGPVLTEELIKEAEELVLRTGRSVGS